MLVISLVHICSKALLWPVNNPVLPHEFLIFNLTLLVLTDHFNNGGEKEKILLEAPAEMVNRA